LVPVGDRNEIREKLNVVLLKRLAELCSLSIQAAGEHFQQRL
jgi:hypothetical protein